MELFVLIANYFKPLTNIAKVPSQKEMELNKALNMPLVFLAFIKNKFLKSEYYKR